MKTILVLCKNNECNRTFRVPEFKYNSTIKSSLKQECLICKNKKLLAKSTMYSPGKVEKSNIGFRSYQSAKKTKPAKKRSKRTQWKEKNTDAMIQHVQSKICNPYIRARDIALYYGRCISCNSKLTQAGHRYSIGDYSGMRFLINNIHGQEISCNHFKSGNIDSYDRGLILRHGKDYTEKLKQDSLRYLRNGHKFHRFDIIEIGITYKYLHKNKIWIFTQKEFNKYRQIAINSKK